MEDNAMLRRARNAVIIIILCIIGAGVVRKHNRLHHPELAMPGVKDDNVRDAVAASSSRAFKELESVLFNESVKPEPKVEERPAPAPRGTIYGNGDHKFEMPEQQRPQELSPSGPK